MTDAAAWRGRVGEVWAREHARTERAFAGVAAVLDHAILRHAPERGRAADIGCGVGSTTLALAAARPGLHVTGIDLSPALLAVARERGGVGGPAFVAGDVEAVLPTLAPLDLLVSRHGVMFFADPVAGFAALRRSVAFGAPLVFSCFRPRADNEWATTVDAALDIAVSARDDVYAPGPFALSDEARLRAVLAAAGWTDVDATAHDVAYAVGGGAAPIEDALDFYRSIGPAASVLAAASAGERGRIEARLRDLFAARIHSGTITFTAATWVVSAHAGKALP